MCFSFQAFSQNNDLNPCPGQRVKYESNLSLSGPFASVKWEIDKNSGYSNPVEDSSGDYTVTWDTPGRYNVKVYELGEPANSYTYVVNVGGANAGTLSVDDQSVCSGETVDFTILGYTGDAFELQNITTGQTYPGVIHNDIVINQTSTFRFKADPTSGCSGSSVYSNQITVSVTEYDPGTITENNPGPKCVGTDNLMSFTLSGFSSDLGIDAVNWWYLGSPGAVTSINPPSINDGTFSITANNTIQLKAFLSFGNCQVETPVETIYFSDPDAPTLGTITSTTGNQACANNENFTLTLSDSDATTVTWHKNNGGGWQSLGTGTSKSNQTITASTTFRATLSFANPCLEDEELTYVVDPIVESVGSLTSVPTSINLGQSITASYSGTGALQSYEMRPDGTANWLPLGTPREAGPYEVRGLVDLECASNVSTSIKVVQVNAIPQGGDLNPCLNDREVYNQMSSIMTEWQIIPSSGFTKHNSGPGTDLDVTWNVPGTYTITAYDVDNGHPDVPSQSESFTVDVRGAVGGTLSAVSSICLGSTVDFSISGYAGSNFQLQNLTTDQNYSGETFNDIPLTETSTFRFKADPPTGCSGPAVYSNEVTVTVNDYNPGTISESSSGFKCVGTDKTMAITIGGASAGLSLYEVKWRYGSSGGWTTIGLPALQNETATITANNTIEVYATMKVDDCYYDTPIEPIVFDDPDAPVLGTISSTTGDLACANNENFTLTLSGSEATTVTWHKNNGGSWQSLGTGISKPNQSITSSTTFRATLSFANPCIADKELFYDVDPVSESVGSISLSASTINLGESFTATYDGMGTLQAYQMRKQNTSTWLPLTTPQEAGVYQVKALVDLECTSNVSTANKSITVTQISQSGTLDPCLNARVTYNQMTSTKTEWVISPGSGYTKHNNGAGTDLDITWNTVGTYTVTAYDLDFGDPDNPESSESFTVEVRGAVGGVLENVDPICPGETVNFSVSGYAGQNFELQNITTGQNYPGTDLTNIPVTETSTFRFKAEPPAGCSGSPDYSNQITVVVNDYNAGTISESSSGTKCVGSDKTMDFTVTGASPEVTLHEVVWRYSPSGNWTTIGFPAIENETASITANNTIEVYGRMKYNNCYYETPTEIITFEDPETPTLGSISSSTGDLACANDELFSLTLTGSDANTVTWHKSDGVGGWLPIGTGDNIPNQSIIASTIFRATLSFASECLEDETLTYEVNPVVEEVGTVSLINSEISMGESFTPAYSGTGTLQGFQIRKQNTTQWFPLGIPQEAGVYQIKALVNLECTENVSTQPVNVTVTQEAQTGTLEPCLNDRVTYNQMTSIKTEWVITPGTGYTKHNTGAGTDLDVTWTSPGIYTVTAYDLDFGDPGNPDFSESFTVTVGPKGGDLGSLGGVTQLCVGESVDLELTDYIGSDLELENRNTLETFTWSEEYFNVSPTTTTTYRVKVTKPGCGFTYSDDHTIVVLDYDPGIVSHTTSGDLCNGTSTDITVTLSGANEQLLAREVQWKLTTDSWANASSANVDFDTQSATISASQDIDVRGFLQSGTCNFYTPEERITFNVAPSYNIGSIANELTGNEVCKDEYFTLSIENSDATSVVWRRNNVKTGGEWQTFASGSSVRELISFDTQYEAILKFPHSCASRQVLTQEITVKNETPGDITLDLTYPLGKDVTPSYDGIGILEYYEIKIDDPDAEWVRFTDSYPLLKVNSYEVRGMVRMDCNLVPTTSQSITVVSPNISFSVPASVFVGQEITPVYSGETGTVIQHWEVSDNGGPWIPFMESYTSYVVGNVKIKPVVNLFGNILHHRPQSFSQQVNVNGLPINFGISTPSTLVNYGDYVILNKTGEGTFVKFQREIEGEWIDIAAQPGQNHLDVTDAANLRITETTRFRVIIEYSNTEYASGPLTVDVHAPEARGDLNFIAVTQAQKETLLSDLPSYRYGNGTFNKEEHSQSVQIFGGLGKEIQSILVQNSPVTNESPIASDMANLLLYDAMGRNDLTYLPYATNKTDGSFIETTTFRQGQEQFFNETVGDGEGRWAKSSTLFEPSPLSRVEGQLAPGTDWIGSGVKVSSNFEINNNATHEHLFKWEIDVNGNPTYSDVYPIGTLVMSETIDEDGNKSQQFSDKTGNVLCKKAFVENDKWAITYYIYDEFNQLRFVLPPMVFKDEGLDSKSSHTLDQSAINAWCFKYQYDERRRMIEKKVPGAEPVHLVYDRWDRLVLTQDGVQRTNNEWMFTSYDEMNRPVMTGHITDSRSRTNLQGHVSALGVNGANRFLTFNSTSSNHQYDTDAYPFSNAGEGTVKDILTITYYDNYDFRDGTELHAAGYSGYNSLPEFQGDNVDEYHLLPEDEADVRGLVTGTKTLILDSNDFLETITYYDDKYRVIQVVSENHLGGVDVISSQYDFVGNTRRIKSDHSDGNNSIITFLEYDYDHENRLLSCDHTLNGGNKIRLYTNEYNQLGQLVLKKLHSEEGTLDYAQEVDYAYNIRGWLKSINESGLSGSPEAPQPSDLFSMELIYQNAVPNLPNN